MNRIVALAIPFLLAALFPSIGEAQVFSGRVVDLQGNPRINVPVTTQVVFQNDGRPFNAFDGNHPDLVSGARVPYKLDEARFFLPIRTADIPSADVSVSLRFTIAGQLISEVSNLSPLTPLELDVVVPDPKPVATCYCYKRGHRHRRR
jgi:hypothetical protein